MKGICLIVWMLISLVFTVSIVGLLMFVPKDTWQNAVNTPSTWYLIGIELLDSVINE
jgi:hypothetical protein